MKIEFLESGSDDCPLVRIYGTERDGFGLLHSACLVLADGKQSECAVHDLPGFESVNDCALTLLASEKEKGVRRIDQTFTFTWSLTPDWWVDAAAFIEPFAQNARRGTFQWLAGENAEFGLEHGDLSLLISCSEDGSW